VFVIPHNILIRKASRSAQQDASRSRMLAF